MLPITLAPAERLQFLVQHDCFEVCALLPPSDFDSYARDRGVDTTVERLERLERLGIFRPMARARRPWIRGKQVLHPNGHVETLGLLEETEAWSGPIREGLAAFSQERETTQWYLKQGRLWHPAERPFLPWDDTTRDASRRPVDVPLYSRFQLHDLEENQ